MKKSQDLITNTRGYNMVLVVEINGFKYYACEVCGLLYEHEREALECESFCRAHPGMCNVELAKISVGYVDLKGGVQRVYFKVDPTRKCARPIFRLCKTSVNIYKAC